MDFTLKNTNVFDTNIELIFDKIIKKNIEKFNREIPYSMVISFDVSLIKIVNLHELKNIIINETGKEIKEDDIIYEAMSSQLDRFKSILKENGIESYCINIQGDNLDIKNSVKVCLEEDKSESVYSGRGKNKARCSVHGIAPNILVTREKINEIVNDRANEIFHKLMNIIHDTKIMSEILEIEETNDSNILLKTFAEKYWVLVFPFSQDEERKKAIEQFKERSLAVVRKCFDNNEKGE